LHDSLKKPKQILHKPIVRLKGLHIKEFYEFLIFQVLKNLKFSEAKELLIDALGIIFTIQNFKIF